MQDPTDKAWLSALLGKEVESATLEDMSKAGGLSGIMHRLNVTFTGGDVASFVVKQTKPDSQTSKNLGLVREALFYDQLATHISDRVNLPQTLYAHADVANATHMIVMEDLSDAIQSGYFFGNYSPHNWGKDLAQLTGGYTKTTTARDVATAAFKAAANLHAGFWMDESLRTRDWLRGSEWLAGQGRQTWEDSQKQSLDLWTQTKQQMKAGTSEINWNRTVVECVDASLAKVSWEEFQREIKARPWMLVHGDCHPANMLLRFKGAEGESEMEVFLVDFEMVGIGSGPQDLGQYMISHAGPIERKEMEEELVHMYYKTLCSLNGDVAASMSWEDCWSEYVYGGIAKWLWMLPILVAMCPTQFTQFFHDQILDFLQTHNITPSNTPMPRV
mmetsp:Transcript_11563/g.42294  ORF Transcript_11563/g.42294 Transcript_11563/m.42294 type:complete len:388 (-) Transcript_11563:30-1193(-)